MAKGVGGFDYLSPQGQGDDKAMVVVQGPQPVLALGDGADRYLCPSADQDLPLWMAVPDDRRLAPSPLKTGGGGGETKKGGIQGLIRGYRERFGPLVFNQYTPLFTQFLQQPLRDLLSGNEMSLRFPADVTIFCITYTLTQRMCA